MMRTQPKTEQKDIRTILTTQVLPWWEQYGMSHLVTSANTQQEFEAQPLPASIQVSVKKRRGRKIAVRGPRSYNNTSYRIAVWPQDDQESIRYPTLACVLRGQADFHIADYVVHCPPGHFVLFNSNIPQPMGKAHFEGGNISKRYCEVLWLMVQPGTTNRILSWICYSQSEEHWSRGLEEHHSVEHTEKSILFNMFVREATLPTSNNSKLAEVSFHAFLLLMARESNESKSEFTSQEPSHHPADSIEMALQHINYYLGRNLTTQSVADAVYMSRSNFVRRFQLEMGQSFNQYLTLRRLAEARRLLDGGTRSVATVARLVGLSPSRLRSLFAQHYGVSPSHFAQAAENKTNKAIVR